MNIKRWEIANLDKDRAAEIAEKYGIPFFVAMLLDIRGFRTDEQITDFLSERSELSDSFELKDMDKAVERIRSAVDNFEKIAVFGDYDADGVTATAMLYSYLETVGADVIYYIPKRSCEGYGMNMKAIDELNDKNVNLIITVDNGIASVDEVAYAKECGIDVVITDHHRPHEKLPDAVAVIDPYRDGCPTSFKELSGAGVALKLLIALEDGDEDMILSEYADLAALGTIADVMPAVGENRTIIKAGMDLIVSSPRPGIDALLKKSMIADKTPTARLLAFTVIPRINATGRMGASERAVHLLTCDFADEAEELASEINAENEERRNIEAEITAMVLRQVENDTEHKYDRVIIASGEGWHSGVIGIVASRVTEHFGKPCMIISRSGDMAKGSGRSVEGFNLFEAVQSCGDIFEKFGGHPMAAGITLSSDKIDEFRRKINTYAKDKHEIMPTQLVKLDCKLNPQGLSPQLPMDMKMLEPFGNCNPQPFFGLFGMTIDSIIPVGGGAHLRIICSKAGEQVTCMKFEATLESFAYDEGNVVDMAVTLDAKEYRGQNQLTICVRDIKLSDIDIDGAIEAYQLYERTKRKEELNAEQAERITPDREDIAAVYKMLKVYNGKRINLQVLAKALQSGMDIGKFMIILEILEERKLITYSLTGEILKAVLAETNGSKVDIYESAVFERIRKLKK